MTRRAGTRRTKTRRNKPTTAAPSHRRSTDHSKQTIERLRRELEEAREQQAATSQVLQVISSSSGELKPVIDEMLGNALRICEAKFGMLMLYHKDEGSFDARVMVGAPPALIDAMLHKPFIPRPGVPLDRMIRTKQAVHTTDIAAAPIKPLSG